MNYCYCTYCCCTYCYCTYCCCTYCYCTYCCCIYCYCTYCCCTYCCCTYCYEYHYYRGAAKSLARPGRKKARKHVRDARDFNNIETRAVIKFLFLQGKVPKKIHAILTETSARFLPGRAKNLSAPLYYYCCCYFYHHHHHHHHHCYC